MQKDDLIRVTIEDLSSDGLGVGHSDGMAFFIKDTVIGDEVEAKIMKMKKTYGYARMTKLLVPSPDRIEARCPVARQCGGCQIQSMSYPAQLRFKENKVRNNLMRIGKFENPPMGADHRHGHPVPLPQQGTVSNRVFQRRPQDRRILRRPYPRDYRLRGLPARRQSKSGNSGDGTFSYGAVSD